jgi:hypothetical protein
MAMGFGFSAVVGVVVAVLVPVLVLVVSVLVLVLMLVLVVVLVLLVVDSAVCWDSCDLLLVEAEGWAVAAVGTCEAAAAAEVLFEAGATEATGALVSALGEFDVVVLVPGALAVAEDAKTKTPFVLSK